MGPRPYPDFGGNPRWLNASLLLGFSPPVALAIAAWLRPMVTRGREGAMIAAALGITAAWTLVIAVVAPWSDIDPAELTRRFDSVTVGASSLLALAFILRPLAAADDGFGRAE